MNYWVKKLYLAIKDERDYYESPDSSGKGTEEFRKGVVKGLNLALTACAHVIGILKTAEGTMFDEVLKIERRDEIPD